MVHIVVRTQRESDRLHRIGVINDCQHQAADRLRNLWEAGTPTHQPVSRNLERPMGEGLEAEHNWRAWGDFLDAIIEVKKIGRSYWVVTQNVVCFDSTPLTPHIVPLRTALDHLYEFFYCTTR